MKNLSREQQFAELLSRDIVVEDIGERMGFANRKTANAMLQRIRRKLGTQAR